MNIFIRSSHYPTKKANEPQVENHCCNRVETLVKYAIGSEQNVTL